MNTTAKILSFIRKNLALAIGSVLILISLALSSYILLNTHNSQTSAVAPIPNAIVSNTVDKAALPPLVQGEPVRIQIPAVGIDLKIIPGYYYKASNSWTLSLNNAQFGEMTQKPNNQQGLTYVYAHFRKGVFYNLPKVKVGDQAIITTDNGHMFTYTFRSSEITNPEDTSLFSYQGKPLLVLQTCTGAWYQNRQLFSFDLSGVQ